MVLKNQRKKIKNSQICLWINTINYFRFSDLLVAKITVSRSTTFVSSGLKPPVLSGRFVVGFKYCAFIKFIGYGINRWNVQGMEVRWKQPMDWCIMPPLRWQSCVPDCWSTTLFQNQWIKWRAPSPIRTSDTLMWSALDWFLRKPLISYLCITGKIKDRTRAKSKKLNFR